MEKTTTNRIVIYEPDAEQLKEALAGRRLVPGLRDFLNNLLRTKKWLRKINVPSGRDDLGAVLVFTTALKEGGLEIFSELHVFYAGKIMVERWEVVGESQRISALPKEAFQAIDIDKVRADGSQVMIEFSVPVLGGQSATLSKTFDFTADGAEFRVVPHPLLAREGKG